ncbi:hypothetical protein ABPG74_015067 [Tetrahymena malaccensis]
MYFNTNKSSNYHQKSVQIPMYTHKNTNQQCNTHLLNEDYSNNFFNSQNLESDIRTKCSTLYSNENDTRSSLFASSSFEFDQAAEDNLSNFLDLESFSRASSVFIQQANSVNDNINNQDLENLGEDKQFVKNKYLEYFSENNDMMSPIAEQYNKEQDLSFLNEYSKYDAEYKSCENKYGVIKNYLIEENQSRNLECNNQYQQSNLQSKISNQNQIEAQNFNQNLLDQYQYYEKKYEEQKQTALYYQQPVQECSQSIPNGFPQNFDQQNQLIQYNTEFKNQENQVIECAPNNIEYTNNEAQKFQQQFEYQNEIQKSNQNYYKDQIQCDYQNIIEQSEIESKFNYYQYYKSFQEPNEKYIYCMEDTCRETDKFILKRNNSQISIVNKENLVDLGSQDLLGNRIIENSANTYLSKKQTDKSKTKKQDKKNMEKNYLVKIESQDEKTDDQIDEEETVMPQTKELSSPSQKQSIDIHTSTTAAIQNEEEHDVQHHQADEEETLKKIEEMKVCNKKNVVKNIMNAFKNFVLEAELKNTPKVNQNIVNLYNNAKSDESDNLAEIIKKFKRYINSKNFNHYSMRLLILHPNYGPVLQYFLKGPIYEWAKTCKANDLASHFVMVDFLLLSFSDIKYIDELKRHEKKKAHYQ